MPTTTALRSAVNQLNHVLRAADRNRDGRLTKSELFSELHRVNASPALRSAAATAYAYQAAADGDLFLAPSVRVKTVTDSVTANGKALVDLDGKRRGTVKDGIIEQKELYASTNNLTRALFRLAGE